MPRPFACLRIGCEKAAPWCRVVGGCFVLGERPEGRQLQEATMTMQTENTRAETEIGALLDDWAQARRTKDPDRVLSHFTDDDVQFLMAPPLQYSGDNAWGKDALKAWFATFEGPMGFEIAELRITAGADTAFCHFLSKMSAVAVQSGPFSVWNRVTLGLRRTGGRWLIAHVHESVPFYMDGSFGAAIDLEP
jgi:PhnB protein